MRVDYWLRTATQYLQSKAILTARLDCLVLLEDTMGVPRAKLLAEPAMEISDARVAHLQNLLNRRAKHEPLAYIRGRLEFYGREFIVNPGVLVPRPESETIIELLLELVATSEFLKDQPKLWCIADVGAGSGALGITAALELPRAQVELLEIDDDAMAVAKTNVAKFTTRAVLRESDLLTDSQQQNDILLCNLPYVPDEYTINRAATHEPPLALFGGVDGLDLYRQLFQQIDNLPKRPLYILSEALPESHNDLRAIADASGYKLLKTVDFIQLFGL